MSTQEKKIEIFIQIAAYLRLQDFVSREHERFNKDFEERLQEGQIEEAMNLMQGPSVGEIDAVLDKLNEDVAADIMAEKFSASERQRTLSFIKSKQGKDFLAEHFNVKGFFSRHIAWDDWLG